MANGSNEIKTLDVTQVLDLASNKHIIDAFVTDENNEQEVVVAIDSISVKMCFYYQRFNFTSCNLVLG
ncbi:hypothetical protein D3C71_1198230 [compost metagenome]|jgi:hypothetical protein